MKYFKQPLLPLAIAVAAATTTSVYAQEESDLAIESIVVTGQKVSKALQDTPESVAVINFAQLQERDISEFSEFVTQTANTHTRTGNDLSIRGIDAFSVSGGGSSALASVYVDGAAVPRTLITNGFSTWDASQVEILRGPQSTLQGRNALAGAVIIQTTNPYYEWEGRYRAQIGEEGEQEFAVAAGGGLIDDLLAVRFTAEVEEFDGFNRNITRNESSGISDNELYRLKFLLTPSSLEGFSALLSYTHATSEDGQVATDVPEIGENPFDNRIVINNDPQLTDTETDLVTLNLDYEINLNWSLTSITTYSDVEQTRRDFDIDNNGVDSRTTNFESITETTSQEFRLIFDYDKITGIIGAYFFEEDLESTSNGITQIRLAAVGLSAPFLQASFGLDEATANFLVSQYDAVNPALLDIISSISTNVETSALFADATYHINDKWSVFGGIRLDHEEQENESDTNVIFVNQADLPDPSSFTGAFAGFAGPISQLNQVLLTQVDAASLSQPVIDSSFTEVIPKLGVSYRWTDDITTSFTVQEGFRSGGVGDNIARSTVFQFDPEFTTNYEFSFRSSWLKNRLTANANLFFIDWTDQQVDVQLSANNFDSETRNAGESEVKGFEVELNYIASNNLTLYGSFGQAKTEFTDFVVSVAVDGGDPVEFDLSGRSFRGAPEWTGNVGVTYKADNGFFANVSANYASDSNSETNPFVNGLVESDEQFDLQNDSRVLVNAQLGYNWDTIGVYLIANNLLDEEYIATANEFNENLVARHTLGNPRQFSISVRGTF